MVPLHKHHAPPPEGAADQSRSRQTTLGLCTAVQSHQQGMPLGFLEDNVTSVPVAEIELIAKTAQGFLR